MRFVNWGGARDGVPDRLSRQETVAKAARTLRVSTSLAGGHAQTPRGTRRRSEITTLTRRWQTSHARARPDSGRTARRPQPGSAP